MRIAEIDLVNKYPYVAWREPLRVTVPGRGVKGLACRFCLAMFGLKAEDVSCLPQTQEEFEKHMKENHA